MDRTASDRLSKKRGYDIMILLGDDDDDWCFTATFVYKLG